MPYYESVYIARPDISTAQVDALTAIAESRLAAMRTESIARMHQQLDPELDRLIALSAVNPAVRDAEIEALRQQIQALEEYLSESTLGICALRVIYTH